MNQAPQNPTALWVLMGINALVYAIWQLWGLADPHQWMAANFLVSSEAVLSGRVWTLITSAFSHVEPMHLLFNMIALYVFGRPVLMVLGSARFTALYLVGGLMGSIGHVAFGLFTGDPVPALGASGAVMAIAVPYGLWFPRQTLLINFFIPVPAWLAVLLFIGSDVLGLFGTSPFGMGDQGIAHAAHLGGALVGLGAGLPRAIRLWRRA